MFFISFNSLILKIIIKIKNIILIYLFKKNFNEIFSKREEWVQKTWILNKVSVSDDQKRYQKGHLSISLSHFW
jgi:hypothetical protein